MRSEKGDDHGRVDEDEEVGDDHERWALDLTTLHVCTALFASRQVISALQQDARDGGKGSREAGECLRYTHREAVCARCSVTKRVSQRRHEITNSLPCHGGRKHEIDDTDESYNLLPGIAGHLGGVVSSVAGYALLTSRTKLCLQVKTRVSERQLRRARSVNNVKFSVSVNASGSASVRILNKSSVILWNDSAFKQGVQDARAGNQCTSEGTCEHVPQIPSAQHDRDGTPETSYAPPLTCAVGLRPRMSGAGLIGEAGSEVGNERPCCCKLRSLVISWSSLFLRQHNQPESCCAFSSTG
jgi:hypothetical protein